MNTQTAQIAAADPPIFRAKRGLNGYSFDKERIKVYSVRLVTVQSYFGM